MSFGLEIFNASGTLIYKMDAEGGLFLGTFSVPATGSNVIQSYSGHSGRQVVVAPVATTNTFGGSGSSGANLGVAICTITYPSGVPTVTAQPNGRATNVYVFVE